MILMRRWKGIMKMRGDLMMKKGGEDQILMMIMTLDGKEGRGY